MKPPHPLADAEKLRELRAIKERGFLKTKGIIASQAGRNRLDDASAMRREALLLAFHALLVDDVEETRRYIGEGIGYAETMLAPGNRAGELRGGFLEMEYSPDTGKPQVSNVVPLPRSYDVARMSFAHFSDAFLTLWAFGSEEALKAAARIPEVEYRSTGLIVSETGWAFMGVHKALALRDFSGASSTIERILPSLNKWQQEHAPALLAAISGDRPGVLKHLAANLKFHQKQARKMPGDTEGLVCYSGMEICRVALWHGIVIEEQDYLPLRFMPGHPSNHGTT